MHIYSQHYIFYCNEDQACCPPPEYFTKFSNLVLSIHFIHLNACVAVIDGIADHDVVTARVFGRSGQTNFTVNLGEGQQSDSFIAEFEAKAKV